MPPAALASAVVTDLMVLYHPSSTVPPTPTPEARMWRRIEKELYLHLSMQRAWLHVALACEEELAAEELVVVDIRVGERPPDFVGGVWEPRSGGIWLRREKYSNIIEEAVTEVDVLFGTDAVEPRLGWTIRGKPLELSGEMTGPVPRLSVRRGRATASCDTLRVEDGGGFKIVQVSDLHMVTGVGLCDDAMDAVGNHLPATEADPLTVKFIEQILDIEKPNLVILTGDQVHHDVPDSQTALFKAVGPIVERSIPFAAVFGNHDSEGTHALSRAAQMSILQSLPNCLCQPGPEDVDGVGNFRIEILAPAPSSTALASLYFLDSHGQIPRRLFSPDYDAIKQSQIDWFTRCREAEQSLRDRGATASRLRLSLVFQHIPLPEFRSRHLDIRGGTRGEPTEGPRKNSHFYDALVRGGISAFGCGHDHVNDFCARLPHSTLQNGGTPASPSPWLCYGGASGFGGYGSFGGKRSHRRARVWQLDTGSGRLTTWKRVQYDSERVDELALVGDGAIDTDWGEIRGNTNCILS